MTTSAMLAFRFRDECDGDCRIRDDRIRDDRVADDRVSDGRIGNTHR